MKRTTKSVLGFVVPFMGGWLALSTVLQMTGLVTGWPMLIVAVGWGFFGGKAIQRWRMKVEKEKFDREYKLPEDPLNYDHMNRVHNSRAWSVAWCGFGIPVYEHFEREALYNAFDNDPSVYHIDTARYGRVSSNVPIEYDGGETFTIDMRNKEVQ